MNSGQEIPGELVVSGSYPAEVLEPAEHALNGVAVPVEVRREAVLPLPVCLRRDVGESAALPDLTTNGVAVVALVGVQQGCRGHPVDQYLARLAVGDVAASQEEGDWPAHPIGQGVDLGGPPAARPADGLVEFPLFPPAALRCAQTAEESMSNCAGGPPALAKALNIPLQMPLSAQRWKRL